MRQGGLHTYDPDKRRIIIDKALFLQVTSTRDLDHYLKKKAIGTQIGKIAEDLRINRPERSF